MQPKTFSFFTVLAILLFPLALHAEELRYQPVNPAFGGNPFNGPYLLSNATAQRQFNAPERERPSAVDQFAETIQRSLLSRVAREVAEQILGENAKDSGSFTVGDTVLEFQRVNDQVKIQIQDPETGGSTVIELAVPQF